MLIGAGAATAAETAAVLAAIAATASAMAATAALLVTFSHRRFEARRAFVEFALKRRIECGEALLASLLARVHLADEGNYWRRVLENPPTPVLGVAALPKFTDIRDRLSPANRQEMNRNVAAAHLFFSGAVLAPTNALVAFTNQYLTADTVIPFDGNRAAELLASVSKALSEELEMRAVLEYQSSLFKRPHQRRRER